MTRLSGKTVLITGAASGIGRLMALDIAHRGATVVAWDIHREPLDDLVREISPPAAWLPRSPATSETA